MFISICALNTFKYLWLMISNSSKEFKYDNMHSCKEKDEGFKTEQNTLKEHEEKAYFTKSSI